MILKKAYESNMYNLWLYLVTVAESALYLYLKVSLPTSWKEYGTAGYNTSEARIGYLNASV